MKLRLTTWSPLVILGVLGILAGLGRFITTERATSSTSSIPANMVVSTGADRGPGSLRSALFQAMRANHHVSIELQVANIELEINLPPVAVANGLSISGGLDTPTLIRNINDDQSTGVLLHLVSENISLANIAVDAAGATGIVVSGPQISIENVTISNAEVGLSAIDAEHLSISNSQFSKNRDGVRIEGSNGSVDIKGNSFTANRHNGLWIVFGVAPGQQTSTIAVHDNRFSGSLNSLTAANAVIDLRGNRLSGFTRAGLTLISSRANIVENRIMDSTGIGMHLADLSNSYVVKNEVGRNQLAGMLIIDAKGLQVDSNEIYENGYGIITVGREPITAALSNNTLTNQTIDGLISIGDTPMIDGNHALHNRQAGIRILDLLLPDVGLIRSSKRHTNNILSENGNNEILFGQYVVATP